MPETTRPTGGSMMEPRIERLLARTDSKFTLVTLAAKRGRADQLVPQPAQRRPRFAHSAAGRQLRPQAAVDRTRGDRGGEDHLHAPRCQRGRRRGRHRRDPGGVSDGAGPARRPASGPRCMWWDRGIQGGRGVPPPCRRRCARVPGSDTWRTPLHRGDDVLRTRVGTSPHVLVGRRRSDSAHAARAGRRSGAGSARDRSAAR